MSQDRNPAGRPKVTTTGVKLRKDEQTWSDAATVELLSQRQQVLEELLAVEEENRTLRDQNFELQSKARAADAQLRKAQAENADKDKQLKIMTDQNSELLRLLETLVERNEQDASDTGGS